MEIVGAGEGVVLHGDDVKRFFCFYYDGYCAVVGMLQSLGFLCWFWERVCMLYEDRSGHL